MRRNIDAVCIIMTDTSIQELVDILMDIKDRELMRRFLVEIFTPAEVEAVVLRWELLKLLHQGVPQREISKRLGISLCKITRGSRELKKETSALKELLRRGGKSLCGNEKEELDA